MRFWAGCTRLQRPLRWPILWWCLQWWQANGRATLTWWSTSQDAKQPPGKQRDWGEVENLKAFLKLEIVKSKPTLSQQLLGSPISTNPFAVEVTKAWIGNGLVGCPFEIQLDSEYMNILSVQGCRVSIYFTLFQQRQSLQCACRVSFFVWNLMSKGCHLFMVKTC